MISVPRGFTTHFEGEVMILTSAAANAVLRYVERARPVPSIAAAWGHAMPASLPPLHLVTAEGEYAWLVEGERDDASGHLTRFLAGVEGDDFIALLEATTTTPGQAAWLGDLVEQLVRGDRHMLGARRRAFRHRAPAGWAVQHRAPFYRTYGDAAMQLFVPPAIPRSHAERASVVAALGFDHTATRSTVHGALSGTWYSHVATRRREAIVLEDATYIYSALVTGDLQDATAHVLADLMRTIEPLPVAASAALGDATAALRWAVE